MKHKSTSTSSNDCSKMSWYPQMLVFFRKMCNKLSNLRVNHCLSTSPFPKQAKVACIVQKSLAVSPWGLWGLFATPWPHGGQLYQDVQQMSFAIPNWAFTVLSDHLNSQVTQVGHGCYSVRTSGLISIESMKNRINTMKTLTEWKSIACGGPSSFKSILLMYGYEKQDSGCIECTILPDLICCLMKGCENRKTWILGWCLFHDYFIVVSWFFNVFFSTVS